MKGIFNLKSEPGEQQVSTYFRKQTGPESAEGSTCFVLRCKGGNKAVSVLMNKVVLGEKA